MAEKVNTPSSLIIFPIRCPVLLSRAADIMVLYWYTMIQYIDNANDIASANIYITISYRIFIALFSGVFGMFLKTNLLFLDPVENKPRLTLWCFHTNYPRPISRADRSSVISRFWIALGDVGALLSFPVYHLGTDCEQNLSIVEPQAPTWPSKAPWYLWFHNPRLAQVALYRTMRVITSPISCGGIGIYTVYVFVYVPVISCLWWVL